MSMSADAPRTAPSSAGTLDGDPPVEAATAAKRRARFFNSGNAFNLNDVVLQLRQVIGDFKRHVCVFNGEL